MVFVPPKDRVLEHSTSNSQTVFAVTGAVDPSMNAFSASMSVGDTTIGGVVEPGVAFKSGKLTYSAANQVTIDSTGYESKGTFSSGGIKEVFMGLPAKSALMVDGAQSFTSAQRRQALDNLGLFPTGTLMLFQQTTAPTGWTKQTTHNDKSLRVVSGSASSGGVQTFSTVFSRTVTDAYTLTQTDMPSHGHPNNQTFRTAAVSGNGNYPEAGDSSSGVYQAAGQTAAAGGNGAHGHGIDIRVQYVDIIIASKD